MQSVIGNYDFDSITRRPAYKIHHCDFDKTILKRISDNNAMRYHSTSGRGGSEGDKFVDPTDTRDLILVLKSVADNRIY